MATLTAGASLRPENCIHKLPTSCRLTATPTCCACQDRRPHSSSYQKYVDGVGFVPWGTRQERYCWPCKEFWNVRVQISGMRQGDTKLPERPNISQFLSRWYDWHRGYRVIKREDGHEERQAMVGEALSETTNGYLPRSTEELRSGVMPGEQEVAERGGRVEAVPEEPVVERPPVELDSEDERLFESSDDDNDEAEREDEQPRRTGQAQPATEHGHLAELDNDRSHASDVPTSETQAVQIGQQNYRGVSFQDDADARRPLRIARDHYQRVTVLRRELQRMRAGIERVMSGLQSLQVEVPDSQAALDQLNALNGRLSRYREAPLDLPELNNPDYQSPISSMFERASRRYNQVQSDRMLAIAIQDNPPARDAQGRIAPQTSREEPPSSASASALSLVEQHVDPPPQLPATEPQEANTSQQEDERFLGLDQPGRPPAIEDEAAFKIDNRCDVCLQQIASVATFPCGHMIMCSWCAAEVIPRHPVARNVPMDSSAKCPQCRRKVRHVYNVRIRVAEEKAVVNHQENR